MSYDLFLLRRDSSQDRDQFPEFFRAREWYKINESQAWYENKDTGVYCSFELSESSEAGEPPQLWVSLNVNYFRPSYFIAEVETEVTALVSRFDMMVFDPQDGGMDDDEYQKELLIEGWRQGNEFAFSTFLKDPNQRGDLLSMPAAELVRIWTWNRQRQALQARYGDSKFVPRICFVRLDHGVASAVVWPDGIPSVIPPVERLIVVRDHLASQQSADRLLLAWQDALPLLERYGSWQPDNAIVLDYDQPPHEVASFVRSLPGGNAEIAVVSPDQVLDRELIDKHSRTTP